MTTVLIKRINVDIANEAVVGDAQIDQASSPERHVSLSRLVDAHQAHAGGRTNVVGGNHEIAVRLQRTRECCVQIWQLDDAGQRPQRHPNVECRNSIITGGKNC